MGKIGMPLAAATSCGGQQRAIATQHQQKFRCRRDLFAGVARRTVVRQRPGGFLVVDDVHAARFEPTEAKAAPPRKDSNGAAAK